MATAFYNFGSDTVDQAPAGVAIGYRTGIVVKSEAGAENGKAVFIPNNAGSDCLLAFTDAAGGDAVDIAIRVRKPSSGFDFGIGAMRTDYDYGNELDNRVTFDPVLGTSTRFVSVDPGFSVIGGADSFSIDNDVAAGNYFYMRFRWTKATNLLEGKAWAGTLGDEPASWGSQNYTTSFSSGLGIIYAYGNGDLYVDWVAVGTAGDPAPLPGSTDTTAPTVSSASVPTAGDTIAVQMSESMQVGAGGSGGWTISLGDASISSAAVDGTDDTIINLTPSRTLTSSDSFTIGYTQPGDGFQDQASTPNDLATLSGQAVTNNSTQSAATLSISAADDVTSDGQTVTFTLANNENAPTGATLNGTDVGTLTDQGSGVYAYTSPLIADDATADLVVSVDSTTVSTVISYANSYPYELVTHGTPDANSIFFDTQFATTGPVEWGVVTDYDSAIVTVDHAAMDTAEDELNDVDLHSTEVAAGTTTATYKYFVPESGATGTFDSTITVAEEVTQVPQGTITVGTITKDENSASIPFTYSDTDQDSFEHSTDGGSTWSTVTSPISRTGLSAETSYSGQIRAVNSLGSGTAVSYSFTTDAAPQVPAGEITFSFPQTEQTSVEIQFQYSASDQTGFEYSLDGGAWTAAGKPITISGLTQETTYNVSVRAVNDVGAGAEYDVNFRTKGEPATPSEDNWPFSKRIKPAAPQTWEHGKRHPLTNMRVRMYK